MISARQFRLIVCTRATWRSVVLSFIASRGKGISFNERNEILEKIIALAGNEFPSMDWDSRVKLSQIDQYRRICNVAVEVAYEWIRQYSIS